MNEIRIPEEIPFKRRGKRPKCQSPNLKATVRRNEDLAGVMVKCEVCNEYVRPIWKDMEKPTITYTPKYGKVLVSEAMVTEERREYPRLTDAAYREMESCHQMDDRVWQLLDLICAEWQSDPTSVQCFDERLVREAIELVKKRKAMRDMFNPLRAK